MKSKTIDSKDLKYYKDLESLQEGLVSKYNKKKKDLNHRIYKLNKIQDDLTYLYAAILLALYCHVAISIALNINSDVLRVNIIIGGFITLIYLCVIGVLNRSINKIKSSKYKVAKIIYKDMLNTYNLLHSVSLDQVCYIHANYFNYINSI